MRLSLHQAVLLLTILPTSTGEEETCKVAGMKLVYRQTTTTQMTTTTTIPYPIIKTMKASEQDTTG